MSLFPIITWLWTGMVLLLFMGQKKTFIAHQSTRFSARQHSLMAPAVSA
jgi:hypothetical protein